MQLLKHIFRDMWRLHRDLVAEGYSPSRDTLPALLQSSSDWQALIERAGISRGATIPTLRRMGMGWASAVGVLRIGSR